MAIDWVAWRRGDGWPGSKVVGRERKHTCPATGEGGSRTAWVSLDSELAGCRVCGDGSGKLTGDQLVEHARAVGAVEVDLGAGAVKWSEWVWTTATGRERPQFRTPDGKRWAKSNPPPDGWPAPADLLYAPGGVPSGPGPVYVCEGSSDSDAALRAGLSAIGRNNARPSAESLARLNKTALYRIWPDHDSDAAGYRQAVMWHEAMTAAG